MWSPVLIVALVFGSAIVLCALWARLFQKRRSNWQVGKHCCRGIRLLWRDDGSQEVICVSCVDIVDKARFLVRVGPYGAFECDFCPFCGAFHGRDQ